MNTDEPRSDERRADDTEQGDSSLIAQESELRRLLAERDARLNEITVLVTHTRHELNNLLTGILGQAQLILMREELTPQIRHRIETLEELAMRIKTTIAQLNNI